MKRTFLAPLLVAGVAAVLVAGCATNESDAQPGGSDSAAPDSAAQLSGTLSGGGASSQTAAQEAWRAGFASAHSGVTINYDPTGSGTGRTNFTSGGFSFAGTDAPFKAGEANSGTFAACAPGSSLVEVPAYISPIAVAFNLGTTTSLNLDAATIAQIFRGQVTNWNDPAIAAHNVGVDLPATAITPVHRSDKSGTTENFTDYLAAVAPAVWTDEPAEEWPASLQGEAAEKTQGVRQTIASTPGAIGYLDASQASALGTVALKVGETYQSYTPEAAAATVGRSSLETGRASTDIVVDLDRTLTDSGVYPLVLVSYLAACQTYADPAQGALVKAYLDYIVSQAGQAAAGEHAGSAPITGDPTLAPKVAAAVATIA